MQYVEKDAREKTGIKVRDLKILGIGAGQDLRNATYVAVHKFIMISSESISMRSSKA
jgi:hypothetical protein